MDAISIGDHIEYSMMFDLRAGIHWVGMILDSGCDPLSRHYILWTQSGHDGHSNMIRV